MGASSTTPSGNRELGPTRGTTIGWARTATLGVDTSTTIWHQARAKGRTRRSPPSLVVNRHLDPGAKAATTDATEGSATGLATVGRLHRTIAMAVVGLEEVGTTTRHRRAGREVQANAPAPAPAATRTSGSAKVKRF